jgi:hypothetical protein
MVSRPSRFFEFSPDHSCATRPPERPENRRKVCLPLGLYLFRLFFPIRFYSRQNQHVNRSGQVAGA